MLMSQRLVRHPERATPWRWAMLGAMVGLIATMLTYAPARWLAAALHEASAGRVQLIEPRGTVWTGSARLQFTGGAGSRDSAMLPSPLAWQLRPTWLALNLQISADCCTTVPFQIRLIPYWRRVVLQVIDSRSQWPATLLAGLGTPWNTVQAEGSLQLSTQNFSVTWLNGQLTVSGQAELAAIALSSRLSTLKPMGSYRLTLVGGIAPTLELVTTEGGLQLSGSGNWTGSSLRFTGVASAAPEHEAALSNLLNIIGRRSGARSIITLG